MTTLYGICRRCKREKEMTVERLCEQCVPVVVNRKRVYSQCAGCRQPKPTDWARYCAACRATPEYRRRNVEAVQRSRANRAAGIPPRAVVRSGTIRVDPASRAAEPVILMPWEVPTAQPPKTIEDRAEARNATRRARYARQKRNGDAIIEQYRAAARIHGQQPEVKAARRARNTAARAAVLAHYGAICICCKDTDLEGLTIDHTFGNGAEHRRQDPTARAIYHWLVKKRFPRGFRVLCGACHNSLTHYGRCSHDPTLRVEPVDPVVVAEWIHA